jgi:hypothetical protein
MRTPPVWIALSLLVAFLVPAPVSRADSLANLAAAIDLEALDDAARVALVQGANWFRKRAESDDEGWFIPPIRQRKVVEVKEVPWRYRLETYEEPVYEYETHVTYVQTVPYEPPRKVEIRRPVRQSATRKVQRQREVADPDGPLTRTIKVPVYGPGGPNVWPATALGDNGFTLYAMRKTGVPGDDPVLVRVAESMLSFLAAYGSPDHTWSLAGMAAGLSVMPGGRFSDAARELAGRLLEGQITDGAARGLWGPMCVNTRLLSAMLKQLGDASEEVSRPADAGPSPQPRQRRFLGAGPGARLLRVEQHAGQGRGALRVRTPPGGALRAGRVHAGARGPLRPLPPAGA